VVAPVVVDPRPTSLDAGTVAAAPPVPSPVAAPVAVVDAPSGPVVAPAVAREGRTSARDREGNAARRVDPPTPAVAPTTVAEPAPVVAAVAAVEPPVAVAQPVVVPPAAPPVAAPPVAAPPSPTLRGVRGSVASLQVSGGIARGAIQGRASDAADALARCVYRAAEAHGGAAALGSPVSVTAVVAVRDRRADEVRLSGGGSLAGGCRDAVLGAFHGDLPQAEDTEYEVRISIALEPQL
jgi:hypothetical protein